MSGIISRVNNDIIETYQGQDVQGDVGDSGVLSALVQKVSQSDLGIFVESYPKLAGETDDTGRLQRAINDAIAGVGILRLGNKVYYHSSTLNVTKNLKMFGQYEKGLTTSTTWMGSELVYTGTGTAIEVSKGDGTFVYGLRFEGIRFSAQTTASIGVDFNGVSESDIVFCHFNGGFNTSLRLSNSSIINIGICDLTGGQVGVLFDWVNSADQNSGINIFGCNFWQNSVAHIKGYRGNAIHIQNNWFEYAPVAFLIDNDSTGGGASFVGLYVDHNNYSVGDSVGYPNSKMLKIQSTSNTNIISVYGAWEKELAFHSNTDYVVKATIANNTNASTSVHISVKNNNLWGAQTSAVYSDSGKVYMELGNNNPLNNYFGSPVIEYSGSGHYVGHGTYFDVMQMIGPVRLSNQPSAGPAVGDLLYSTSSGTAKVYDGTTHRILAYSDSGATNARPTTNLYAGRFYFDTTLNKPVFYNGTNGWVDATGATV